MLPLLPDRPIVGYGRKSTDDDERQVMSLDRQKDAIYQEAERRGSPVVAWFEDKLSGKNFERSGYQSLITYCTRNRQPPDAPGIVLCYEYDRFARSVNKQFKVDMHEYNRAVLQLHDVGWELDFVLTPRSGEGLADAIMGNIKPIMAAEYLTKLSGTSRAGKRRVSQEGYWIGGPPPWPCMRFDTRLGVALLRSQRSSNASSILVPHSPEQVRLWEASAEMFLAGKGYYDVIRFLRTHGVYSLREPEAGASAKGRISPDTLFEAMTNPAIVGRVIYNYSVGMGTESIETKLRWDPIVNPDLFWRVKSYLEARRRDKVRVKRGGTTFIKAMCWQCGAPYRYNEIRGHRYLVHPTALSNGKATQDAITEAACQHWSIRADQVEQLVYEVVKAHRASPAFYQAIESILRMQDDMTSALDADAALVASTVTALERQLRNLTSSLQFAESPEEQELVFGRIREVKRSLADATKELDQHRRRNVQSKDLASQILDQFEDTPALIRLWDMPGEEGKQARQHLFTTWVSRLCIEVESEGKGRKNSQKRVHMFLRTLPDSPITREITSIFSKTDTRTYFHQLEELLRLELFTFSLPSYHGAVLLLSRSPVSEFLEISRRLVGANL